MNASQYFILIVYLLVVFFYIIGDKIKSNGIKNLCNFFGFLILILVVTRSERMADYESYVYDFTNKYYSLGNEPTFTIIKYLVQNIFKTFYAGFIIYALLSVGLRIHYINKYRKIAIACILVYLSNMVILQDMIAIRSAVAAAILLYVINAKNNGQLLKCCLLIFLGVLFHYSALIFVIILLMDSKKPHSWLYISAMITSYVVVIAGYTFAAILGSALGDGMIPFHFLNYENTTLNIFNLLQIGHLLICVFAWVNIERIQQRFPQSLLFLKVYTLGVCLLPLFSDLISVGIRLSELFLSVEIVLVPMIFAGSIRTKAIQKITLIAYTAIILFFNIINLQYWDSANY